MDKRVKVEIAPFQNLSGCVKELENCLNKRLSEMPVLDFVVFKVALDKAKADIVALQSQNIMISFDLVDEGSDKELPLINITRKAYGKNERKGR